MDNPEVTQILQPLRLSVKEQGDLVRQLKQNNVDEIELKKAIAELKIRKKILEEKELSLAPKDDIFERSKMEDLLKQRFFYDQSFSIYGGINGLYDFGPVGCAIKANLIQAWRNFFIVEEQMLEVECSMLTPEVVLQASGHVERFCDLMVKDVKTGECFRADHLVKACLEKIIQDPKASESVKEECRFSLTQIDGFPANQLEQLIRKHNMKSPTTGNDVSSPIQFNLMFDTSIGPTGQIKGFLRPETAQGIFVNFKRLLDFNQSRLPFAAAQIGHGFRNEISPRSGLIRVREFAMAEIEHFHDPNDKSHPKFKSVAQLELPLLSGCDQMDGKGVTMLPLAEAVEKKIIANQVLGYFIARIYQFLVKIGLDSRRIRFRQHLSNEMAHYAKDCWDAETLTSYGWVECVGCADRSAYDLSCHAKVSGARLCAEKRLDSPKTVSIVACSIADKKLLGMTFKKNSKVVNQELTSFDKEAVLELERQLTNNGTYELKVNDGSSFTITPEMVSIERFEKEVHVEEIIPAVIEPSFGIGRMMYSLFEHTFKIREGDEQRSYFSLPPLIAPYKCSVLPLSSKPDFTPFVSNLSKGLTALDIMHRVDDSGGSIGRRYARTDAIAIPFGITVDFDTISKEPHTATLRERDTMKQVRVKIDELPSLVHSLITDKRDWNSVLESYPVFTQQESTL